MYNMAHIRPASPQRALAEVGQRLRNLRIRRRMTQSDLAQAAGVSLRTLNRLEWEGDVRFETIVRVAFALRVVDQLDRLFAPEDTRSLDELIGERSRGSTRVRKPRSK